MPNYECECGIILDLDNDIKLKNYFLFKINRKGYI